MTLTVKPIEWKGRAGMVLYKGCWVCPVTARRLTAGNEPELEAYVTHPDVVSYITYKEEPSK